jgi:hypothetical protein
MQAQMEKRYSSTHSLTSALDGGGMLMPCPRQETRYPLYRRLGGPQGQSEWVQKILPHQDSIPSHPAHSESLYWLSYPSPIHDDMHIRTWQLPRLAPTVTHNVTLYTSSVTSGWSFMMPCYLGFLSGPVTHPATYSLDTWISHCAHTGWGISWPLITT